MEKPLRSRAAEALKGFVSPERRYTVSEIARRLGVSRQTVTSWCAGATVPQLEHAAALEAILGIPTKDWLPEKDEPSNKLD
ncbi:MAG: hypothetical protein AMXMBFR56_68470 [Polyangiaceae bacterium]